MREHEQGQMILEMIENCFDLFNALELIEEFNPKLAGSMDIVTDIIRQKVTEKRLQENGGIDNE